MKKILIFTAGFGEGHNTAARNVQEAIEHLAADEAHVEVVDLFDSCYGRFNDFVRKAYVTAINKTPLLWQGIYAMLDHTPMVEKNMAALSRMRKALAAMLDEVKPDAVVSTYPLYNFLIEEIYGGREGRPRPFAQITVVTDSISVNSLWYRSPSDYYIVANDETAEVMKEVGIAEEKIRVFGFPVQLAFVHPEENAAGALPELGPGVRPRVLYIINSGKKKASKIIGHLLEHPDWDITVTVGRDAKLLQEVTAQVEEAGPDAVKRVTVVGWTNQMPQFLLSHHVLVSKAGGATVQEAIAARCPMVVNQIVPGQEEGNYELLRRNHAGVLAEKPKEISQWLERLFENDGSLWHLWRKNITRFSRPDSSLQAARFILDLSAPENVPPGDVGGGFARAQARHGERAERAAKPSTPRSEKKLLLCDFHTHTTYSDGKLTVRELVDFYGQRGFDCLCVTDHLIDPARLIGQVCKWSGMVLSPAQVPEYFETLQKEAKRAWKKYEMILMTGVEFNKDGYTAKSSAHLLGIDLQEPIDPSLDLRAIIGHIHAQGGLAVASHPHKFQSEWGKNTLYLWEHQEEFAPLLDAWEIANRDDLYTPIGLKRLPFLANSDFHKPKHIQSWKTLLCCEKDREAIKQCVRINRDVALTLYREHRFAAALQPQRAEIPAFAPPMGVIPFPQAA